MSDPITTAFKDSVCSGIRLIKPEDDDRNIYHVVTPFMFADGGHLSIDLKLTAG